jgi:hypothetical protein
MATARSRWLVAVAGMAMMGAGCGSSAHRTLPSAARPRAPASAAPAAGAAAVGVIRGWSTALRRGDVDAAARYFALPSEFVNGTVIEIHTEAEARAANAALPCGALLISAARRGSFISALFRLTNRPGPDAGCGSGAGQLARTNFIISGGRIRDWIRAPETGGGNPPGPTGPTPAPAPAGPVV